MCFEYPLNSHFMFNLYIYNLVQKYLKLVVAALLVDKVVLDYNNTIKLTQCLLSTSSSASHLRVRKGCFSLIISPSKNVTISGYSSVRFFIFRYPHMYAFSSSTCWKNRKIENQIRKKRSVNKREKKNIPLFSILPSK